MGYNIKLMVKVASLYYKENLIQEDIAKKLKVSKYQVNRILKKAIESGIVQISVIDPSAGVSKLEENLEKRFNLKRAIVVENSGLSDSELKVKLGAAGADLLLEVIKDNDVLGVSWGTTVNELVNHLPSKINRRVEVVQVTGGSHQISVDLNCHDITGRIAKKFGVEPHLLYAPAILDSKKLHDMLLNEKSIKDTFQYFDRVSVLITGIGSIFPKVISSLISTDQINKEDFEELMANDAVGDVFSYFFNTEGKICQTSLNDRIVSMPSSSLKKVPYRIGIAGGRQKSEAILGALRGNIVNMLITDDTAAERILKIDTKK